MRIKLWVSLVLVVAVAVLSWITGSLMSDAGFSGNGSALGQVGANLSRAMEQHFADTGHYPKSLAELSVDLVHADGGNKSDLEHATYLVEGSLAIVILERFKAPAVLLEFRNGKSTEMKFLGTTAYQSP